MLSSLEKVWSLGGKCVAFSETNDVFKVLGSHIPGHLKSLILSYNLGHHGNSLTNEPKFGLTGFLSTG